MIRLLLVTLIPVSGCVTGYTRDTDKSMPRPYDDGVYYILGWKEKFIVKPGPEVWRQQ